MSVPHLIAKEPVLRIKDVYPGSGFFHPGSWVRKAPDAGFAANNLCIFNPKNCYSAIGNMIRDVYPGSGFFPVWIPVFFFIQGSKKTLDPRSGSATLQEI
jgi:hypothetical protein